MKDRYHKGLTDYRYRHRLLSRNSHHPADRVRGMRPIHRLVVGKKNRYLYAGIYTTPQHHRPDVCHYYGDTRNLSLQELGVALLEHLQRIVPAHGLITLDKGRRRHLKVEPLRVILHRLMQAKGISLPGL